MSLTMFTTTATAYLGRNDSQTCRLAAPMARQLCLPET